MNKGDEDDIKLIEPGEDAAKSLEPSEQSFDLVAFFVHGTVIPTTANRFVALDGTTRNVTPIHGSGHHSLPRDSCEYRWMPVAETLG